VFFPQFLEAVTDIVPQIEPLSILYTIFATPSFISHPKILYSVVK
jgi:hypothetical protein